MAETKTVKAKKVREGDFLPGLGRGYVVDVEHDEDMIPARTDGRMYIARGGDYVLITFHDSDGEENDLILTADCPVTVERGGMI